MDIIQQKKWKNRGGMSRSPEYSCWSHMKERCLKPNTKQYKDYGGRGIKICDEWMDFDNFYKDMGVRPSSLHTIDRIDNDGNYEPNNCRWTTRKEQVKNQRKLQINTPFGHKGVYFYNGRWMAKIKPDYKAIHLGSFDTKQEALKARQTAEKKFFN